MISLPVPEIERGGRNFTSGNTEKTDTEEDAQSCKRLYIAVFGC